MTLDYFWNSIDFLHKSIDMALIVSNKANQHEGTYAQSNFLGGKLGMVALDNPGLLQFFHSLVVGRRGQTNVFRKLCVVNLRMGLKNLYNRPVDFVKFHFYVMIHIV